MSSLNLNIPIPFQGSWVVQNTIIQNATNPQQGQVDVSNLKTAFAQHDERIKALPDSVELRARKLSATKPITFEIYLKNDPEKKTAISRNLDLKFDADQPFKIDWQASIEEVLVQAEKLVEKYKN